MYLGTLKLNLNYLLTGFKMERKINPVDNPNLYPQPPLGFKYNRDGTIYAEPFQCWRCYDTCVGMSACERCFCEKHLQNCYCYKCRKAKGMCWSHKYDLDDCKDCTNPAVKLECGDFACSEHFHSFCKICNPSVDSWRQSKSLKEK
jgi:hypothetical protein